MWNLVILKIYPCDIAPCDMYRYDTRWQHLAARVVTRNQKTGLKPASVLSTCSIINDSQSMNSPKLKYGFYSFDLISLDFYSVLFLFYMLIINFMCWTLNADYFKLISVEFYLILFISWTSLLFPLLHFTLFYVDFVKRSDISNPKICSAI